jgi:formylglycine-generating enzyme required for sulfatase activity
MKRTLIPCLLVALAVRAVAAELAIDLGNQLKVEMVLVSKGSFQQGSAATEAKREADETVRPITLSRDFYLGKYPVTRGQFARFVAESNYRTEAERGTSGGFGWNGTALVQARQYTWRNPGFPQTDDHPVTIVTYGDALAFCGWLSRKSGRTCQLPTEAEWEYACRAGTPTAWHHGDDESKVVEIAWYKPIAGNTTHPVKSLKPNPWGLYFSGNVYEWCRDWYAPYASGSFTDPLQNNQNLSDKPRRVLRGGSWLSEIQHTRSAARYRNTPASRNADNGFRVMTYDLEVKAAAAPRPPQASPPATPAAVPAANPPLEAAPPPASRPTVSHPNVVFHSSFALGAPLCPLAVFGVIAVIIVMAVRAFTRARVSSNLSGIQGGTTRYQPGNVRTVLADDGFWMEGSDINPGTLVSYMFLVHGIQQRGEAAYQPGQDGRQFVYTGDRPEQVSIIKTDDATDIPPILSRRTHFEDHSTTIIMGGSSHRYPSAY